MGPWLRKPPATQSGVDRPTHIFVQAGVGSLAGAVQGYFANLFPDCTPTTVIMEAQAADCLYKGAVACDGDLRIVDGDLQTIMAGLACGEPNTISWDILKITAAFSSPALTGWQPRGCACSPRRAGGDRQVVSGESGAVGMGLVATLMENDDYRELREAIGLDKNSRVLMFSTEGDTDPENYRRIVWDGAHPSAR